MKIVEFNFWVKNSCCELWFLNWFLIFVYMLLNQLHRFFGVSKIFSFIGPYSRIIMTTDILVNAFTNFHIFIKTRQAKIDSNIVINALKSSKIWKITNKKEILWKLLYCFFFLFLDVCMCVCVCVMCRVFCTINLKNTAPTNY